MKKRIIGTAIAAAIMTPLLVATPTANAEEPIPSVNQCTAVANAICSEYNGVAVMLAYGEKQSVKLNWSPERKYEDTRLLYSLVRSDGARLLTKTNATSYTDRNLLDNTAYTYTLTVDESYTVTRTPARKPSKGNKPRPTTSTSATTVTKTKHIGSAQVTAVTKPGQVVGLGITDVTADGKAFTLIWQPPRGTTEATPVTYSLYANGNLRAYGITGTSLRVEGGPYAKNTKWELRAENSAGEAYDSGEIKFPL